MVLATDPVGMGFVTSLARPTGNGTGLSNRVSELQGKMLQLLKQALPGAKRIVVLWNPRERNREPDAKEAQAAAKALGLQAQLVGMSSIEECERVFAAFAGERPDAVLLQPNQIAFFHR